MITLKIILLFRTKLEYRYRTKRKLKKESFTDEFDMKHKSIQFVLEFATRGVAWLARRFQMPNLLGSRWGDVQGGCVRVSVLAWNRSTASLCRQTKDWFTLINDILVNCHLSQLISPLKLTLIVEIIFERCQFPRIFSRTQSHIQLRQFFFGTIFV